MKIKSIFIYTFLFSFFLYSCNDTGNEPNEDTNTHNISEASRSSHAKEINIDERNVVPPNILNDGSTGPYTKNDEEGSAVGAAAADAHTQPHNTEGGEADVQDTVNQQEQTTTDTQEQD